MTQQQLIKKKEGIHLEIKSEMLLARHIVDQIRFLNTRLADLEESVNKKWDKMQMLAEEIEELFIKNEIAKNNPS